MAAVPQTTLTWLWSVLTKNHYDPKQTYRDPNRTYHDVARALAQYPSVGPRTDVYTFENGLSSLLLHLTGTLPVAFRGATYNFPIDVWIPNTYPLDPPLVYVTPAPDMVVRSGQHVTLEGRVYHHYLAHWSEAWDRVSIAHLFGVLQDIFAREPPVKARTQAPPPPPPPPPSQPSQPLQPSMQPERSPPGPPPVPSLPAELATRSPSGTQSAIHAQLPSPIPPKVPPKPGQSPQVHSPPPPSRATESAQPPLPPKGSGALGHEDHAHAGPPNGTTGYAAQRPYSLRTAGPQQPHATSGQPIHSPSTHPERTTLSPSRTYDTGYMPQSGQVRPPPGQYHPPAPSYSSQQPQPLQPAYQPQYQPQQYQTHYRQVSQQTAPQPMPQPPKPLTPDLLTSPFDVELPSIEPTGPPPPVPPNPAKDALLRSLSQTLTENLQSTVSQSKSAVVPLRSQAVALQNASDALQGEIASLSNLQATLQSNIGILQQSLHHADTVIADAKLRINQNSGGAPSNEPGVAAANAGLPPIDDVLVAPTVVGKQLYDLVAEERGTQQAIYALQAALVKGVIGTDTWSRHTRGLAREAFMKRALIRKIGTGMGLDVDNRSAEMRFHR